MTKKENNQVEVEEVVVEETVTEVVETKKGLLDKAKEFGQKHGKKLIAGIALGGAVLIGYSIGKSTGSDSDDTEDGEDYDDYNETNGYESEESNTIEF